MTFDALKKLVVEIVEDKQGCKMMDLVAEIVERTREVPVAGVLVHIVEELETEGAIVALTYTLPAMPYRTKQFLLPGDTKWHTYV